MRCHVPTSYTDMKKIEWRHFDTASQLCFLEWLYENVWARSVMLICAIFNVFHNRQSTMNILLPNSTTTFACTRSPSTWPIFSPTVPHGQFCTRKRFFFPLFDKLVCAIQNNQPLDALTKYVSYHILYSGQLEIHLSVHIYRQRERYYVPCPWNILLLVDREIMLIEGTMIRWFGLCNIWLKSNRHHRATFSGVITECWIIQQLLLFEAYTIYIENVAVIAVYA